MKIHLNGRFAFLTILFVSFSFVLISGALAQVESGTINGTVFDNSGAVISGARVTITNQATNQPRSTATNTSGEYSVPFLPPGTYDIEASKDGFSTSLQRGIVLQIDQTLAVNVTLKLGGVKETIEVTAQTPPLQTETATLGNVVNGQQVQTLHRAQQGRVFLGGAELHNLVTSQDKLAHQGHQFVEQSDVDAN